MAATGYLVRVCKTGTAGTPWIVTCSGKTAAAPWKLTGCVSPTLPLLAVPVGASPNS